jgi:integrase
MASQSQYLIRNRHSNQWYGRVVIPTLLRDQFNGKREVRRSLQTSNKTIAKRRALAFWLQCQEKFERIHLGEQSSMRYIETHDALGRKHVFDLDDPKDEEKLAREMHENANKLLAKFSDNPEILERLLAINDKQLAQPAPSPTQVQPETATSFSEAVDLYIDKLNTQGRKGKKLSQRTLLNYQGRLTFWKEVFGNKHIHDITLSELSTIQIWLTRLPANFVKKGLTTEKAVKIAKTIGDYPKNLVSISDKTRAEYLGQLKGILEYAHACGFTTADQSRHVEIPNTKQIKAVERLPFSDNDLVKIFPKDYGVDFGKKHAALDWDVRYWFPLIALYSGARLEEICQLKTDDIKTCPDTDIIYMNITDSGISGDGQKKHAKNKNSVRPIPVHSALIERGFLDYVEKRKAGKKDKSLFKLKRDNQGRLGKGLSNWFSRFEKRANGNGHILGYIERRGVASKGSYDTGERWTKTFHSFRHTAIDNLRGKKLDNGQFIREQDIGLVMGHEKGKLETANYGADRSQLELRKAVIEAIQYEGIAI